MKNATYLKNKNLKLKDSGQVLVHLLPLLLLLAFSSSLLYLLKV